MPSQQYPYNEAESLTNHTDDISDTSSSGLFELAHLIRREIVHRIDAAYSTEEIRSTTFDLTTVRPLRDLLGRLSAPSVFYALLFNRIHFQIEAENDIATELLCLTRANVCELLAIRLTSNYVSPAQSFRLLQLLTISYNIFAGVSMNSFRDPISEASALRLQEHGANAASTALELAVVSEAKNFLATPIVQRIVDMIYNGQVEYLPKSRHSLIADSYKLRGAQMYDVRNRPFLDHYRLRVPRIRAVLETLNFLILLSLFVAFQAAQSHDKVTTFEVLFNIFTLGFCLDEIAQLYASDGVYFSDLWNALDATYILIYLSYLVLRLYAIAHNKADLSATSFDVLALSSIILLPRLVGTILKRNVVILGIQSMFFDFGSFMLFASISCGGFFLSLLILNDKSHSAGHIFWLMLRIWLGSAYLGFDEALDYHPVFGPIVMTLYAVFTTFLLLTILISILTDTFARVQRQANAEHLYQKAVKTLERLKGDALLEYTVPGNLLALAIIGPASCVLNPRDLHKLHVFLVSTTSLPILFVIAIAERWKFWRTYATLRLDKIGIDEKLFGMARKHLFDFSSGTEDVVQDLFSRPINPVLLQEYVGVQSKDTSGSAASVPKSQGPGRFSDLFSRAFTPTGNIDNASVVEVNRRLEKIESSIRDIEVLLRGVLGDGSKISGQAAAEETL